MRRMFAARGPLLIPAGGGGIVTAFSVTLNTNDSGDGGYSFRTRVTTEAGSGGQVRVRFVASTAAAFSLNNASIGKGVVSPASPSPGFYNTQATPVELLFSGLSGFAISAGQSIVSDWANLTWHGGDGLVVVMDFGASNGNPRMLTTAGSGSLAYQGATSTYNESAPTEGSWASQGESVPWVLGFDLIETQ